MSSAAAPHAYKALSKKIGVMVGRTFREHAIFDTLVIISRAVVLLVVLLGKLHLRGGY
jgi:hypothetical protein